MAYRYFGTYSNILKLQIWAVSGWLIQQMVKSYTVKFTRSICCCQSTICGSYLSLQCTTHFCVGQRAYFSIEVCCSHVWTFWHCMSSHKLISLSNTEYCGTIDHYYSPIFEDVCLCSFKLAATSSWNYNDISNVPGNPVHTVFSVRVSVWKTNDTANWLIAIYMRIKMIKKIKIFKCRNIHLLNN